MATTDRSSSVEDKIREIVDRHFEDHEDPHVTISNIWALLNLQGSSAAVIPGDTKLYH